MVNSMSSVSINRNYDGKDIGGGRYSVAVNSSNSGAKIVDEAAVKALRQKYNAPRDEFSSNNRILSNMDVEVSDGFLGMGKRTVKGNIAGKAVDLKLDTGLWKGDVKLSGTINDKPVELNLKDYKLIGNLSDNYKDLIPYLTKIMEDQKRDYELAVAAV